MHCSLKRSSQSKTSPSGGKGRSNCQDCQLTKLAFLLQFDRQAGDKSLAGVIAHEIAHSWTGNLVTNKNFEHFWLNEGFTVFVERKILGRMQKGEATRSFEAIEGWKDLQEEVQMTLISKFQNYLAIRAVWSSRAFKNG